MDSIVHGVTKSWTRLSEFHFYLKKDLRIKKKKIVGLYLKFSNCITFQKVPRYVTIGPRSQVDSQWQGKNQNMDSGLILSLVFLSQFKYTMVRITGSGVQLPGCKSQLCHLLEPWNSGTFT